MMINHPDNTFNCYFDKRTGTVLLDCCSLLFQPDFKKAHEQAIHLWLPYKTALVTFDSETNEPLEGYYKDLHELPNDDFSMLYEKPTLQ